MKKYVKPALMALALEADTPLCGSCADKGANMLLGQSWDDFLTDYFDKDGDGSVSRDEFMSGYNQGVFGTGENECTEQIDYYCKFTGSMTVAWS